MNATPQPDYPRTLISSRAISNNASFSTTRHLQLLSLLYFTAASPAAPLLTHAPACPLSLKPADSLFSRLSLLPTEKRLTTYDRSSDNDPFHAPRSDLLTSMHRRERFHVPVPALRSPPHITQLYQHSSVEHPLKSCRHPNIGHKLTDVSLHAETQAMVPGTLCIPSHLTSSRWPNHSLFAAAGNHVHHSYTSKDHLFTSYQPPAAPQREPLSQVTKNNHRTSQRTTLWSPKSPNFSQVRSTSHVTKITHDI